MRVGAAKKMPGRVRDALVCAGVLLGATGVSLLCRWLDPEGGERCVSAVYLFAVALISRLTAGYFCGVAAAVVSVFGINFAFTAPYMEFNFIRAGYPLMFGTLLATALLIGGMTTQLKKHEQQTYLARLEEARANLLRAVSHDLRTPLTAISTAASVLAQDAPDMTPQARTQMLAQINDEAQWLIRMVENLLSITRIHAQEASVRKTPEAAEEVVAEAVRKYRKRFSRPEACIQMPDELVMVPMDAMLIGQVLGNLLENAALHAQGARTVTVRLRVEAEQAAFEVEDDGAGIAPERLGRLFDPEVGARGDNAANTRNNMGIGLSVCRTIIAAHGGALSARNLDGGGACFRFTLPMQEGKPHA